MKTIIVPTDFSKNALNAVKYAFAYSEKAKSKIVLFHSYDEPVSGIHLPFSDIHFGKEEARSAAETKMKKLGVSIMSHFYQMM